MRNAGTTGVDARPVARQSQGRPSARATPIILPAIVPRAAPCPEVDWPILVYARREALETWADFLEGDASVYDLMRARRRLDLLLRDHAESVLRESEAWRGHGG